MLYPSMTSVADSLVQYVLGSPMLVRTFHLPVQLNGMRAFRAAYTCCMYVTATGERNKYHEVTQRPVSLQPEMFTSEADNRSGLGSADVAVAGPWPAVGRIKHFPKVVQQHPAPALVLRPSHQPQTMQGHRTRPPHNQWNHRHSEPSAVPELPAAAVHLGATKTTWHCTNSLGLSCVPTFLLQHSTTQ